MSLKEETKSKKKFSKLSKPDVTIVNEENSLANALPSIAETCTDEVAIVAENTKDECLTSSNTSLIAENIAERRRLHFLGYR